MATPLPPSEPSPWVLGVEDLLAWRTELRQAQLLDHLDATAECMRGLLKEVRALGLRAAAVRVSVGVLDWSTGRLEFTLSRVLPSGKTVPLGGNDTQDMLRDMSIEGLTDSGALPSTAGRWLRERLKAELDRHAFDDRPPPARAPAFRAAARFPIGPFPWADSVDDACDTLAMMAFARTLEDASAGHRIAGIRRPRQKAGENLHWCVHPADVSPPHLADAVPAQVAPVTFEGPGARDATLRPRLEALGALLLGEEPELQDFLESAWQVVYSPELVERCRPAVDFNLPLPVSPGARPPVPGSDAQVRLPEGHATGEDLTETVEKRLSDPALRHWRACRLEAALAAPSVGRSAPRL